MHAAILVRNKRKTRKKKKGSGKFDPPPRHVATRDIPPFPPHPPFKAWATESQQPASAVKTKSAKRKVPNGKPAWQGDMEQGSAAGEVREYRTLATAAHRRWLRKNNQVEDVESSLQKDGQGGFTNSSSANIVLYVGLGMIAIGLIITFVGLGERGFQTDELKLIGPSLIGSGLLFCLLRIFSCTIAACRCCHCCRCCRGNDEESQLITPKPSRVHKSAGPITRPSVHPNFISDGEESDTGAAAPDTDGEMSHVPVLPPIRGGKHAASGPSEPSTGELLLDPQGLDRAPSRGSVMQPLTPRRRDSTVQIENEIDDLIK